MGALNRKQRLKYTSRIISQVALYSTQGNKNQVFRVIFDGFSQLGGIYVKFLQILSARAEFKNITSVSAARRTAVFDNVEPDPVDVHQVLSEEIGPTYGNHLTNIQTLPFAAGSFGQVYYAQHRDGTPVIIKILRPSLLKYIRFDLKVLRIILRLIDASPFARSFNTRELFADFKDVVLTETDYPREVQNAMYFYEYFKDHPNIVIPKSYPEISSRNILVQEFIEGIPLTDLLNRHEAGQDIQEYVQRTLGSDIKQQMYILGHELSYSALMADYIHGDPHAGNIKILTNNRVGLFDFGITAEPPTNRLAFKDIIKEYMAFYEDDFDAGRLFVHGLKFFANRQYRAINTVATAVKNNDPNFDLMNELKKVVNKSLAQNEGKIDVNHYVQNAKLAPLFREAINENNRFALDIEFDGAVLLKAADTYQAMLDRMGLKNELMGPVYKSVIDRVEASDDTMLKGKGELMDLEQAIEIVSAWMQELIERDPLTFHGLVARTRQGLGGSETAKPKDDTVSVNSAPTKQEDSTK